MTPDVYVTSQKWNGVHHYQVWVDGEVYDSFSSQRWLTGSEMRDVAAAYREALDA